LQPPVEQVLAYELALVRVERLDGALKRIAAQSGYGEPRLQGSACVHGALGLVAWIVAEGALERPVALGVLGGYCQRGRAPGEGVDPAVGPGGEQGGFWYVVTQGSSSIRLVF